MRGWLSIVAGMAATVGTGVADEPNSKAANLVAAHRVLVIAHRGDSKAFPENTLPAFESAVKIGSDLVELDYVHTSDGIPIVIHDVTLDRTTNAVESMGKKDIRVDSLPWVDLGKLDAGSWFDPKFQGTKLPTLEESLDVIQNGSVTLIERKEGDAKTCIELLKRKRLLGDVVVQAFDWQYLVDCHKLRPDLVICALGQGKLTPERMDKIDMTGASAIGWNFKTLGEPEIRAIHDRGKKAWAWTVDDEGEVRRLVAAGVDGIITNIPAKVKEWLGPRKESK